jgi:hypothetical protein
MQRWPSLALWCLHRLLPGVYEPFFAVLELVLVLMLVLVWGAE